MPILASAAPAGNSIGGYRKIYPATDSATAARSLYWPRTEGGNVDEAPRSLARAGWVVSLSSRGLPPQAAADRSGRAADEHGVRGYAGAHAGSITGARSRSYNPGESAGRR